MTSFWAFPSLAAMGIPCLFVPPVFLESGTWPEDGGGAAAGCVGRARSGAFRAASNRWRSEAPDSGLLGNVDGGGCGLFAETPAAATATACDTPGLLAAAVEEPEPTIRAIEASSLLNTGVAALPAASPGRSERSTLCRTASPPSLPVENLDAGASPRSGL